MSCNHDIPEWTHFIVNPKNKANLFHFLYCSLCESSGEFPNDLTFISGVMDYEDSRRAVISKSLTTNLLKLSCSEHIAYCVEYLKYEHGVTYTTDTDIDIVKYPSGEE